jgi:uncharacterized protein YggT (Ycf19 family)
MSLGREPNLDNSYNQYPEHERYADDERDPQRGAWPNTEHADQTEPLKPLPYNLPANPQIIQTPQQPQSVQMNQTGPIYPERDQVDLADEERVRRQSRQAWNVARISQVIYVILGALDTLLVIRFVLKLLAANPEAGFTMFIYNLTDTLVKPFQDVFPSPQNGASVLDLPALLAIIVYSLLAWLIVNLLEALAARGPRNAF